MDDDSAAFDSPRKFDSPRNANSRDADSGSESEDDRDSSDASEDNLWSASSVKQVAQKMSVWEESRAAHKDRNTTPMAEDLPCRETYGSMLK